MYIYFTKTYQGNEAFKTGMSFNKNQCIDIIAILEVATFP